MISVELTCPNCNKSFSIECETGEVSDLIGENGKRTCGECRIKPPTTLEDQFSKVISFPGLYLKNGTMRWGIAMIGKRTDIDSLPAGRELDALIHDKVMGLEWCIEHPELQPYSTDISAAWEVVEKLNHHGFLLSFLNTRSPGNRYLVEFRDKGDYVAAADTAPLAICRAALKALSE